MMTLRENVLGTQDAPLRALTAVVACLLLIACVNVSTLSLARRRRPGGANSPCARRSARRRRDTSASCWRKASCSARAAAPPVSLLTRLARSADRTSDSERAQRATRARHAADRLARRGVRRPRLGRQRHASRAWSRRSGAGEATRAVRSRKAGARSASAGPAYLRRADRGGDGADVGARRRRGAPRQKLRASADAGARLRGARTARDRAHASGRALQARQRRGRRSSGAWSRKSPPLPVWFARR